MRGRSGDPRSTCFGAFSGQADPGAARAVGPNPRAVRRTAPGSPSGRRPQISASSATFREIRLGSFFGCSMLLVVTADQLCRERAARLTTCRSFRHVRGHRVCPGVRPKWRGVRLQPLDRAWDSLPRATRQVKRSTSFASAAILGAELLVPPDRRTASLDVGGYELAHGWAREGHGARRGVGDRGPDGARPLGTGRLEGNQPRSAPSVLRRWGATRRSPGHRSNGSTARRRRCSRGMGILLWYGKCSATC
jgi:hypothetical protein